MFNFLNNNEKFFVIDVGSHKVAGISFEFKDNVPSIMSMEHQKSRGINQNKFNNVDELSLAINKVYKRISKGYKKNEVFCSITDPKVFTKKIKTEINSGRLGISRKEIRKIFRKSITESKVHGKDLIYTSPNDFILDDKNLVSDPLGKVCSKLCLVSFNIFASHYYTDKLRTSFEKKKINIKNFFDSGVASSIACVSENEKKEGVICIDIGCETTKVVVYMKNNLIYAENFTLGGNNVSLDLSHGLQISDEAAELAKIKYGTVVAPFNEKVELELDSNKRKLISKNLLYGIIKPRYDEILEIIRDKVFDNIYARVAINSVVLTGGASKIFGLKNICENIFNRKTRIATNLIKNSFFYDKPEFSTLIGMIKLVKDFKLLNQVPDISQNKIYKVMDRIDTWIEESYI